jgi:hypothetical protein
MKPNVGPDHPSRYALVEIDNVHDDALEFESIHRVLFGVKKDVVAELQKHFGSNLKYTPVASSTEMIHTVAAHEPTQRIAIVGGSHSPAVIEIYNPKYKSSAGPFRLSGSVHKGWWRGKIDYVHGDDVLLRIASKPGIGIYLPGWKNPIYSRPSSWMALFP